MYTTHIQTNEGKSLLSGCIISHQRRVRHLSLVSTFVAENERAFVIFICTINELLDVTWFKRICNYMAVSLKVKYTFHVVYHKLPFYQHGGNSDYFSLDGMFILLLTQSHCILYNIFCTSCQVLSCIRGNVCSHQSP